MQIILIIHRKSMILKVVVGKVSTCIKERCEDVKESGIEEMAGKSYWNEMRQRIHEHFEQLQELLNNRKAFLLSNVDKMEQSYYDRLKANEKLVDDLEKMKQLLEEATIGNEASDARSFCMRALRRKTEYSKMLEIEEVKFAENVLSPINFDNIGEIVVSCNISPKEAIEVPFKPHFIKQHSDGDYYIVSNRGIEITDENLKLKKQTSCKHSLLGAKMRVGDLAISDKHLYISVTNQNRVQMYDKEGQFLKEIGKELTGAYELRAPTGLCVHKKYLLICEQKNNRVQVLSNHTHSHFIGNCEGLLEPCSVSVTTEKMVVVLHSGVPSINMYDLAGKASRQVYLDIPRDSVMTGRLVVGENGDIMVTDTNNGVIYLTNSVGSLVYRLDRDIVSAWHSNQYQGTCMNNEGEFMICDQENRKIQKFKLDSFSCNV